MSELKWIENKIKMHNCEIRILQRKKANLKKPSTTLDTWIS